MQARQRGTTLVELIYTGAIAAVLLGVAVPGMQALRIRSELSATNHALVASVNLARTRAVLDRQSTVVCPRDGSSERCRSGGVWDAGWLVFVDADGDGRYEPPADQLLQSELRADGDLPVRSSKGRPRVRFAANGMSRGGNVTIRICDPNGRAAGAIVLNNGGRVRSAVAEEVPALAGCG